LFSVDASFRAGVGAAVIPTRRRDVRVAVITDPQAALDKLVKKPQK
jgi:hypothetical protein